MARKPNWVNLSVVYHLFNSHYRHEFTQLTMCMQMMLVGDYVAYVLNKNDPDFRAYIRANLPEGTTLKHYTQSILMMHNAWGVEE